MPATAHNDLANRLFAAIEAGDIDAVRALYAPDAVVWHNNDGAEQSPEQNLVVLQWVVDNLADRAYEDVRRVVTYDGFVQQQVLVTTQKGFPLERSQEPVARRAKFHCRRRRLRRRRARRSAMRLRVRG